VNLTAEITIRYQLNRDSVAVLHEFIGQNFLQIVLIPTLGSVARSVTANYKVDEIKRAQIESEILNDMRASLQDHLDSLFQITASEQDNPGQYRVLTDKSIRIYDIRMGSLDRGTSAN
jgi:hypothetical protein